MELTKTTAKKLFNESPDWFKKELEKEFGEETFLKINFKDIKTFADACEALGLPIDETVHILPDDSIDEQAYKKLKIINRAINQDWTPDWNNSNQYKWWPYFNLSSGFGFSDTFYYYDLTGTRVGSRLCFESKEKAEYAGKQFLSIYKEFLT